MATDLTSADIAEIARQSDVISKNLRDNFTNLKNKLNELNAALAAVAIGTTNAETTLARPFHDDLKERLDSIWSGQTNYVKSGGVVTINAGDAQKVDITAVECKINGIDTKTSSTLTSGTIAFTSASTRYDVVVVNSDSTITIVTGSESADPVLPSVASTQRALWVLIVFPASVNLGWDARNQGCISFSSGRMLYDWKIQDANDNGDGDIYVGSGQYYEEVTLSADTKLTYDLNAKHYRIADNAWGLRAANNTQIIGGQFFGNSKAGSNALIEVVSKSKVVIRDCVMDGNASSLEKDITISGSSNIHISGVYALGIITTGTCTDIYAQFNEKLTTRTLGGTLTNFTILEPDTIDHDGTLQVDTVIESTATAGVTIEGVLLKDNDINQVVDIFASGDLQVVNVDASGTVDAAAGIITDGTALKTKVIDIGDWDMDADAATGSIAHGVGDFTTIRDITAVIINDATSGRFILNGYNDTKGVVDGGVQTFDATNIILNRSAAGQFDNTGFDFTPRNRGHIIITYEA